MSNTTGVPSIEVRRARESVRAIRDYWATRIESQIRFASALSARIPELQAMADPAIAASMKLAVEALRSASVDDLPKRVADAEHALSPIAGTAKEFTVYCVGHAHIDMNWMWGWQETVAATNDTFTTMTKLLDEYPHFVFGQSQASVYRILEEYNPRLLDEVKQLVRAGRIEVTASHWVECDKNMVTGESLCRHLLYTRRYMEDLFGLTPEDVPIDWAPDTFGHARTVPTYLAQGGVRYAYLHRPGTSGTQPRPIAFRWRGPDGAEVLVRNDMHLGYNGAVDADVMAGTLLRFFDELGLTFNLFVFGVGDHGGGPTRRDLAYLADMDAWPVFPHVKGAKSLEFFRRLEDERDSLPVLDEELNLEFTGCYTTQSLIKKANAYGQRKMVETEAASVFGGLTAGMDYPFEGLRKHWRNTLFHHFHDILPGSGVRDTRIYTHGMYQEAMAFTGVTTTEALRKIAGRIDTSATQIVMDSHIPSMLPRGMGGGIGKGAVDGGISAYGFGDVVESPVYVAFNLTTRRRTTVVRATVWDWPVGEYTAAEAVFPGEDTVDCQLLESGSYWGHQFRTYALPLDVPGYGYRSFRIRPVDPSDDPSRFSRAARASASADQTADNARRRAQQLGYHHICSYAVYERGPEGLSNEFLKLTLDTSHGGIRSLVHKPSGLEVVSGAESILEYVIERARPMSAWEIEHHGEALRPRVLRIRRGHEGPYVSSIAVDLEVSSSRLSLVYRLEAGDPRLYIEVSGIWFERGGEDVGTPTLRLVLPSTLDRPRPRYETPFGAVERSMEHGEEVPALRWADVEGAIGGRTAGILMVNDCKHGHSLSGGTLRLTLLRSSYHPDPLPEVDEHHVLIAVEPHEGPLATHDAMRISSEVTEPVIVVQTDVHPGEIGSSGSFLRVAGRAVVSAVKQAEAGEALVVRLFNPEIEPVGAEIEMGDALTKRIVDATAVDLLERPVDRRDIEPADGVVRLTLGAHELCTLLLTLG